MPLVPGGHVDLTDGVEVKLRVVEAAASSSGIRHSLRPAKALMRICFYASGS